MRSRPPSAHINSRTIPKLPLSGRASIASSFEEYIATEINGELKHLSEVFFEAKRNAFWVVEGAEVIVGSFGIESRSEIDTELRRTYLDRGYRGLGIAQRMLDHAERCARALGFTKMMGRQGESKTRAASNVDHEGAASVGCTHVRTGCVCALCSPSELIRFTTSLTRKCFIALTRFTAARICPC